MPDPDELAEATEEPGEGESAQAVPKGRQSFSKLRRELSEEELASPAAQKMLLDEVDRLDREVADLKGFREQFHEADKRCAIVEEKLKRTRASEITFWVALTVGAAAMGYAPSAWSKQPTGALSLAFGAILVFGGIVSRVVQR